MSGARSPPIASRAIVIVPLTEAALYLANADQAVAGSVTGTTSRPP
jgi:hypothetical protein